ncbi:MAG: hypothetical protein PVH19_11110, partial [Planctomycetia bacterium]
LSDSIESCDEKAHFEQIEEERFAEAEGQTCKARRNLAGAYLMGLWGLPDHIVDVIAYYSSPSDSSDNEFGPLAAVHVANTILEEGVAGIAEKPDPIDMDFLKRIGCADRLDRWREICLSTKSEGVLS